MQRFTDERKPSTPDEIWFLEHRGFYPRMKMRARRTCWPRAIFPLCKSIAADK